MKTEFMVSFNVKGLFERMVAIPYASFSFSLVEIN